jgi:ATP-binding cassette subfamily G (WHITE) protein 2 (PDR)
MYRVSPYTYLVSAVLSVGLANAPVYCSSIEFLKLDPLPGTTCYSYLSPYIEMAGGYLVNPEATSNCEYCPISNTNAFLKLVSSNYDERWRDFGILWIYVGVNVVMALFFYWLVRVPKKNKKAKVEGGGVKGPGPLSVESNYPMNAKKADGNMGEEK